MYIIALIWITLVMVHAIRLDQSPSQVTDHSLLDTGVSLGVFHTDVHTKLSKWQASETVMADFIKQLNSVNSESSLLETSSDSNSTVSTVTVLLERRVLQQMQVVTYFGNVKVNGQDFKVLFDTGSCQFWVPSSSCVTPICMRHSRFNMPSLIDAQPKLANITANATSTATALHRKVSSSLVDTQTGAATTTSTSVVLSKKRLNLSYLSGHVSGPMVYTAVSVGGVTIPRQLVGLPTRVEVPLLRRVAWDGILGLGFPTASALKQGIVPVFDTLMHTRALTGRGLANQFGYRLGADGGALTFGGADCSALGVTGPRCEDKFSFAQVRGDGYWSVRLLGVEARYGNRTERVKCPEAGCKAIVDTGTYLSYGPRRHIHTLLPTRLGHCGEVAGLPDLVFTLAGAGGSVKLTVKPRDYVLRQRVGTREDCAVGVAGDAGEEWTIGQGLLSKYYTLFDRDHRRVGFAEMPVHDEAVLTEVGEEVDMDQDVEDEIEDEE